jgi:hypothetical protein
MRKQGSGFFLKAITIFGIAVFALSACGGGSDSVTPPVVAREPDGRRRR